ncbi:hypothetical protein SPBR_08533 [Sporothrix brasiliensis 5110]|uniref:PWI domain-containing protein n=1 Tax=Sporothrix brasiliensis 5110 TaxID=1398154 RepID=A0A0C2IJ36_9PEZI|nr:uncharacterized protein SPBR_08533 [Sporothrix brasiliensis 5110]KIH86995.1 hypothetical protein SPBR_08533 [Sporothrix brasiliensis 5110]
MATGVDAKLLKSTKFPPIFNQKVDTQKVNLQVMKKHGSPALSDILGNDDDVVIELCCNLIESARHPDIKSLQIQLTGFLESQTPEFCKELWTLLLSAQSSPQGIPRELLEAKKMELIQEKIEAEKAADEARRKRSEVGRFDRDRPPQGGDRGDSWRGGAGGGRRGNDSRRGRRSFRGNDGSGGGGGQGGRGGDRDQTPPGRGRGKFRSDRGDGFRSAQHDLYVPNDRLTIPVILLLSLSLNLSLNLRTFWLIILSLSLSVRISIPLSVASSSPCSGYRSQCQWRQAVPVATSDAT